MAKTNTALINSVINDIGPLWSSRVSSAMQKTWDEAGLILSSETFSGARNEIYAALVNRIGLVLVNDLITRNPLAAFKSNGSMYYGDFIEEMGVDIVSAQAFRGVDNPRDQFTPELNEIKVAFHKINRQNTYCQTIGDIRLRKAFIDKNGLDSLLMELINALYRSNTVDEYIYTKRCFRELYCGIKYNGEKIEVPIKDSQIIEIPDIRKEDSSIDDIRKAIYRMKTSISLLDQNSNLFNQMGRTQSCSKDRLCACINLRAINQNEVQNLSILFNENYNKLGVETIEVDGFGAVDDKDATKGMGEDLIGVIHDRDFIQIRDNLLSMNQAQNAASLYVNYFYHVFQIYMASPFKNAIFLKAAK